MSDWMRMMDSRSSRGREGCWAGKGYAVGKEEVKAGKRCPEERPLMRGWSSYEQHVSINGVVSVPEIDPPAVLVVSTVIRRLVICRRGIPG